jgi:hypothetical protein
MSLSIRRPEYTGENRCWPCTALNAVVVIVASVLVGVVSPPAGIALCLAGAALVTLRGYVVPSTPRFAPRLVSALPIAVEADHGSDHRTDGGRRSESLVGSGSVDGEALIRQLVDAGVVTTDDAGDVHLDGDVRRTWEAGMDRLRDVPDADLASSAASAAPFPAAGRVEEDWIVVERTEGDGGNAEADADTAEEIPGSVGDEVWLSRAHAVTDTAAVAAMSDRVDGVTAARAATPFRLFLERCPRCGGTVEETTAKQCCGGTVGVYDNPETPLLACVDCDEPLYEF